jgi:hypothetical protein
MHWCRAATGARHVADSRKRVLRSSSSSSIIGGGGIAAVVALARMTPRQGIFLPARARVRAYCPRLLASEASEPLFSSIRYYAIVVS